MTLGFRSEATLVVLVLFEIGIYSIMPIYIYNSLSRKKDPLGPLSTPSKVKMYVCGPTVYDEPHIGHARSAYIFDVIRKYLLYKGYKVKFVRNVTDVDDKIIDKALKEYPQEELNSAVKKVSLKYLEAYHQALTNLGITSSEPEVIEPKASEYIGKMIEFIQQLIERGMAYQAGGDVYFDITKAKNYGKLSNQSLDKMEAGARVSPLENKKNPLDFVLWKSAKENEPSWPSPWGAGRPGWHIECSVMSSDILGSEFDIHGGGIDLIFPHHENEIAQSEGAGKKFARYWIHHGLLTINGQKMAKSLGNFITVNKVLDDYPDYAGADILKLFFLHVNYYSPINFSKENIHDAKMKIWKITETLQNASRVLRDTQFDRDDLPEIYRSQLDDYRKRFELAMDDDFNTPKARVVIFEMADYCRRLLDSYEKDKTLKVEYAIQHLSKTILELGGVLGLFLNFDKINLDDQKWVDPELREVVSQAFGDTTKINERIEERSRLKKEKKFAEADKIRKELEEKGIILEDAKDGKTTWRRKL